MCLHKDGVIPGCSYSSPTQVLSSSQRGSTSPAVFFSDLEFKRITDLGITATGNKAGRLDPACSATGLQGPAYLSPLGPREEPSLVLVPGPKTGYGYVLETVAPGEARPIQDPGGGTE